MDTADPPARLVAAWRRHDDILRLLLDGVPRGGLAAVPTGSRGRDVAAQFFHLDRVRRGWVHVHQTGKRPSFPRYDAARRPTKAQLRKALKESGRLVAGHLEQALAAEARIRHFGGDPIRWAAYLIAHESHHRGQILLALKQSGKEVAGEVALDGVWKSWISGA